MKIQTFSIVVGGKKCNAKCPYCVSKMTKGVEHIDISPDDINVRNLRKACLFAKQSGVSTVLLTGVGEPLLHTGHIQKYLQILDEYDFPFIDLQTNGIEIKNLQGALAQWYCMGLNTVSLSVAHWKDSKNKEILGDKFVSLKKNIATLHKLGLSVRVSCVMAFGYIYSVSDVLEMISFCKKHEVEQLTCRNVGMPLDSKSSSIKNWVQAHQLGKEQEQEIADYFARSSKSTLLLELPHGANVYDYDGQNISVNNCLTHSANPDRVRQLIYSNDGHLRYSWTHKGAIIL
jgi:molybdenum cofactor biosynthesis enzyme MoaA